MGSGAEDEDRTRIMSLEGSGPAIGRPPRRRGMESNHHPAFFKRVREPSLLPRQNWLRDQELHLATPAYEAGSTLGLPALRNLVAAVGYDPTRSRQSARSRALIRRTRSPEPTAEVERGTGNDPATSCLASKRSPTELPPQLVETVGIEPTLAACKAAVLPLNHVPVNFKTNCRCSGRANQTLAPSARASTNLPGRPENEKPLAGRCTGGVR